jgi:pimeloyl-ACP methyl ester carboxylesterase
MLEAAQSGHGRPFLVRFLVLISFLFGTSSKGQQLTATTGIAEVNGAKLYYEVMGEGRPLVLIHGGGIDSRMWDDHFKVYAEHYKVIRYDLRGSGKSDVPTKRWSHVEDLRSLLRFLRVDNVYLLGLSRGAQVSADFIFEYPDMVDALILASPNLDGPPSAYESPGAREAAREDISLAVDELMKNPYQIPQRQYEAARRKMRVMLADNAMVSLFIYRNFHLQRPELPATRRISAIRVPTLLIVGGNDHPDALANYARETELIPGARKVVIPGANHVAPLEKPEEFNRIVLGFLGQLP